MPDSSSNWGTSPGSRFCAPAGISALKLVDATSAPVFHDLTSMVYCGDPFIFVLVMT